MSTGLIRPKMAERISSGPVPQKNPSVRPSDKNQRYVHRGPPSRGRNQSNGEPVFLSPEKGENRRPRRNSESSVAERKPPHDDERRRHERRRREPEKSGNAGRRREPPSSRTKKPKGLDLIDKLDVTGIYGPGCKLYI